MSLDGTKKTVVKSIIYFLDESDPRDLIDNYLLEVRRGREGFNKDELYGIIFDLFAAGSETTSTTLRYVQKKIGIKLKHNYAIAPT